MSIRDYNKKICMIIKNGLTGEQIKFDNIQDISLKTRQAIIEDMTEEMTKNNIGYYVSYMYEQ